MRITKNSSKTPGMKLGVGVLVLFVVLLIYRAREMQIFIANDGSQSSSPSTSSSSLKQQCQEGVIYRPAGLPPIKDRRHIPQLLEARKFTDGAEIGVKYGRHAGIILRQWKSCQSMRLIDLWKEQDNYIDGSNANDKEQEQRFQNVQNGLKAHASKTIFMRMLSVDAALLIPDTSLDYIYVDARHDYCGVKEDLNAYYSKLRPGGIFAGHDFLYSREVGKQHGNWSICGDGSVNDGAVRGAVQEFAQQHGLVVSVMYGEQDFWTWMMQKPTIPECVQEVAGATWTDIRIP